MELAFGTTPRQIAFTVSVEPPNNGEGCFFVRETSSIDGTWLKASPSEQTKITPPADDE